MLNQPSDKAQSKYFQLIANKLASDYSMVSKVYNAQAEKAAWQARFFAIHAGTAVFIDVIDTKPATKPIKVVIHNRDWTSPVPKDTLNHFFKYLDKADAPFKISKGGSHD